MGIISIIAAILALGFIVFFHELGHFIAAKLCGVGVLEFSIGMGPRILSTVYKNTRYSLKLLPLGGSCAMLGEDAAGSGDFSTPKQEQAGETEQPARSDDFLDYEGVHYHVSEIERRNFQHRPAWQRFLICIAGVAFNFILAFLLAMFVIGSAGYDKATVVDLASGAPVASSGLQKGDVLTAIIDQNGKAHSVHSYRDVTLFMTLHADEIDGTRAMGVRYLRDGVSYETSFLPTYAEERGAYMLGITFNVLRYPPTSVWALLKDSAYEVRYNIAATVGSLRWMAQGRVKSTEVMGPVGTVAVIGDTVQESTKYGTYNAVLVLANLSIMISANLGVMNLLPIPALDGGRLLFILVEFVTRRRIEKKAEDFINAAGMIFLLALMMLIMGNDIKNLITGVY